MLIPSVSCTYFARENFRKLAENNFQNGKWNLLTVFLTKNIHSLSIRHFVPMFFVLSIVLPLLLGLFIPLFFYLSLVVFVVYLLAISGISFHLLNKNNSFLYLVLSFVILHFSYGVGSVFGLFKGLLSK